jgi:hypothetical protein
LTIRDRSAGGAQREQRIWERCKDRLGAAALALALVILTGTIALAMANVRPVATSGQRPPNVVMLILRGIASSDAPRGQLDDKSALAYARRVGYRGEVLDIASNGSADGAQVKMATERIRHDEKVRAIYGFSGGGYNARRIYARLNRAERQRIRKVVVVGSPGVTKGDFPESADVLIKGDPPAGHMAGPKALLDSISH